MKSLYGWGFGMKRQAISRAISSLKDKEVTFDNIPEELAQLSDGTTFVHEQDQELHVYYSERAIEVRALWRPPVPEDHVAYEKCKEFEEYLHSTWFDGPYKDMWNKWELVDLKTANIAEAYHKRLNVEFGRDHPDLRTLIEKLKYIEFEAKCSLQWIRFGERYLRGVTGAEIEEYCEYMSRYVSGKTI
nr:unnamed protein product [Haemonchus contortus]